MKNNIVFEMEQIIDSYDNECLAPQFWEEKCTVITTPTPTEKESEIAS
jgi:hypothetical protein